MQAVEGANAQARTVAAGQVCANLENVFGHVNFHPQTSSSVFFQVAIQFLRTGGGNLALEDVLCDGMGPFRVMKRSKPN